MSGAIGSRGRRRCHTVVLLALTLAAGGAAATGGSWEEDRTLDGITLQSRPAASGFREYQGSTAVCTSLTALQAFVGDASRFVEWIPYTESARALPDSAEGERYYVRTTTPWPLASRDMVYQLSRIPAADGTLEIAMTGVPDALPAVDDAVRMAGADGLWKLTPNGSRIDVSLRLAIDPGSAPAFLVNRRLAGTVAGTLANLTGVFPCGDS